MGTSGSLDIAALDAPSFQCNEDSELCAVGDADGTKVLRAWYGNPEYKWREEEGIGVDCTDNIKEQLSARGMISATNAALDVDPAPGIKKVLLVQMLPVGGRIRTCKEHQRLLIPGGADNVKRAWYGNAECQWQDRDGAGELCTERVIDMLQRTGKVIATNEHLRCDPAPCVLKKLLVEVKVPLGIFGCYENEELFVPVSAELVLRAWYGDPQNPWQEMQGVGIACTRQVRELMQHNGTALMASNFLFGDPAPGRLKMLLIEASISQSFVNEDVTTSDTCQSPSFAWQEPDTSLCVVCESSPKTHAFVPCGHQCVCGPCSKQLFRTATAECPICRTTSSQAMQIFD